MMNYSKTLCYMCGHEETFMDEQYGVYLYNY